jgi:hypothetical protein
MSPRDRWVLFGVTASLALAVTFVFARLSKQEPQAELGRPGPAAVLGEAWPEVDEDLSPLAAQPAARVGIRPTSGESDTADASIGPTRRREGKKREAEYFAAFSALQAERGSDALERAVRDVLASDREPVCRKVAGLRALHTASVPGTDTLLTSAVEDQPDVSDGLSSSVPRCALRLLFARAPTGEPARKALAHLAFVQEAHVSPELRRIASASLAASMPGVKREDVVVLLRAETDPRFLAGAEEALARDTNFDPPKAPAKAPGSR